MPLQLDIPRFLRVSYDNAKKQPDTTVVLLHGIGSRGDMWHGLSQRLAPYNIRVVAFDLLGFGDSPKPRHASYSLRQHARAVSMSLLRAGIFGRVVLVGHSLGSLVAIECAKRYPWMSDRLVLCSPPIYRSQAERARTFVSGEKLLTDAYTSFSRQVETQPEKFISLVGKVQQAKIAPPTLHITPETLHSYLSALKNSIVAQTSYRDIQSLRATIDIIYGRMDPLVLPANYRRVMKHNPRITLHPVVGFHEISRPFFKPIVQAILREHKV